MYLGGKARHPKEIVNVILNMSAGKTTWIEPFVGAGSVITKVPKHMSIYGSDIDSDLIALLQYVQQGGEFEVFEAVCLIVCHRGTETQSGKENAARRFI